MRASRSTKKPAERIDVLEPEEVEAEIEEGPAEDVAEDAAEPTTAEAQTADGQPKKKRTRRGTRGGRSRKKPAAAAAASDTDTPDNGRPAAPRIHVPPADLEEPVEETAAELDATGAAADTTSGAGVDGASPKKKRSRRGSRGGRKRKKPAAANGGEESAGSGEPAAAEAVQDDGVPEYVPMSEWIEDFDASRRA